MQMVLPSLSVVTHELVQSRLESLIIQEVRLRVLLKVAMTIYCLVTQMFNSSKTLFAGENIEDFRLLIPPKLLRLLPLVEKSRKFFLVMNVRREQFSIT